jgi:uncharacterized low-complexity protein
MNDASDRAPSNGGSVKTARYPGAPAPLGRFGVASPEQLGLDREPTSVPRQKRRRRRWPWALGSVATAAALCTGAFIAGRVTKPNPPPPPSPPAPPATADVVALTQAVSEGQILTRGDLTVITLIKRPGVRKYFAVSMESDLVGRRVRIALPAGALIVGPEIANGPWPAKGQALVGLDLQPSEAPTGGALVAGDQVGVLFVPAASQPPYPAPVPLSTAKVVSSVAGQSGDSYVTVLVPAGLAARLAAYAQHDEVALVRLGPAVAWPPPTTAPVKPKTSPPTTTSQHHGPSTAVKKRADEKTVGNKGGTGKSGTGKSGTGKSGTVKSGTGKSGTGKSGTGKSASSQSGSGTAHKSAPTTKPGRPSSPK